MKLHLRARRAPLLPRASIQVRNCTPPISSTLALFLIPVLLLAVSVSGCGASIKATASAPATATAASAPTDPQLTTAKPQLPSPIPSKVPQSTAEAPARPTADSLTGYVIQLDSRQFTPPEEVSSGIEWLNAVSASQVHVLLQLYAIPDAEARALLEKSGIHLLDYVSSNAWFASVPTDLQIDDAAIAQVRWLGPILPEDKVPVDLLQGSVSEWALREGDKVSLDISFFSDVSLRHGEDIVQNHGGEITNSTPISNKLTIQISNEEIRSLAAEDGVRWIDVIPPPPTIQKEEG